MVGGAETGVAAVAGVADGDGVMVQPSAGRYVALPLSGFFGSTDSILSLEGTSVAAAP